MGVLMISRIEFAINFWKMENVILDLQRRNAPKLVMPVSFLETEMKTNFIVDFISISNNFLSV